MSKKQLLSSQTVLLRGAGRTNIEYSAGPNINITDDVISGRDWSQEMAQIVKGGVSASLSGGDNIQITNDQGINIISVTGDLYSAGPNIDITDRTISGKDWTDDIDSHIASAISGKADSSAIPEIVEYSAGDNINITDHVVSGRDWSYEIGQKVGRDEFISGMSAVTEHMVETVSSTSAEIIDIISATSGQGGGSCPWISGGKDYGSATEQLQFGSVLPIFSSWGLCADHNHYIWMKGAYIRLPDIDPYLSSYLPLSSFSSYTASTYNWLSSVNALANSAYTTAVNNYHNKLDISAWSAFTADADTTHYSAGNGIDITDHVISFTGSEGQTYSAGDNIDITNNVISGKSWTDEIIAAVSGKQPSGDYYSASNPSGFITSAGTVNKLDISSFTAYTASHSGDDNQAYSAGANINVTNHVISGKDWSTAIQSAISGLSGKYVSGNNTTGFELKRDVAWNGLWDIRDVSANASSYNLYSNQYNGDAPNPDYDKHLATLSSDKLVFSSNKSGAEQVDIPSIQRWNSYSSKQDGLTFDYDGDNNISAINGSAIGGQGGAEYSAGANINITNNVISGKSWQNEINAATSGKMDKSMSGQFVRGNNTSGYEISSKADGVSAKVSAGYDRMYISAHGSNYNSNVQIQPDRIYLQYSGANGSKAGVISIDSISSWDAKANPADVSGLLNLESPFGTIEIDANKIDANTSAVRITNTLTQIFTGVATAGGQSGVDARNATRIFYRCNGSGNHGISCGGGESYYRILPNTTGWYTGHIGTTGASSLQFWGMEITGYSGVYSGEKVELAQVDRFEHDGDGNISAYNGSAFAGGSEETVPLSAGANIAIIDNETNVTISSKDWTDDITAATSSFSSKLDVSSFNSYSAVHSADDNTPYSGASGIKIENHLVSITGDVGIPYSGASGIKVEDHIISISGDVGHTYSGISPVVVDNTNDTIGLGSATWFLSAGNGITLTPNSSVNALVIAASQSASGNKVTYDYSTPTSAFTSQGDLLVRYATSQSTPARTQVWVGDHQVGILAPTALNSNSFLMQDYRGSLQWVDASAVVPSSMSAQASYFSKTYTSADEGDSSIDDYPEMNRDWTFNIINWKDISIYYSAAQGTATLDPGYGVRVHYDKDSDWLDAEPEYYVGGIGMKYATCDMLDNRNIEYVATSAQATQSGVLYIITGSN